MHKFKQRIKQSAFGLVVASGLLVSALAQAQGLRTPAAPTGLPAPQGDVQQTLLRYINIFLGFVGIIAVAYIIYGGFRYITSAGNDESAEAGKKMITNAIIGLVVIIFSYIIVNLIIRTLGIGSSF